ncbi:uncharacterized protein EV420DRAFT_1645446 [Desarmillaria tabescens]|uniref:F-box domain-containing protein n=1 Tax=Armillaria tabescens TaxID=1929756 RepID=A0AA39N0I3_ARMTA|nr:uncharacterized protein EV420DRAFT_1645446 [Desarmillaria tabescens]KAK0452914.1 hypothetical protein EV420DRAFT_1645446 [Desarmillaria tabescens]
MYTFPQELIDAVIDQLHGDKPEAVRDLLSCSLVSRAFASCTRTILFEDIALRNSEDSDRCFHAFLASQRSAGPVVKALLVEPDNEEWDIAADPCLEHILSLFPNLKTAKLSRMNWGHFPTKLLTALFSAPQL